MIDYTLTREADVKESLNISVSTYDAIIKRMVYGVTEFIQSYTNRATFKESAQVEYFSPNGETGLLLLSAYPVSAFTSLQYRSGTQASPTWNTYDASTYDYDAKSGVLKFSGVFTKGTNTIRANYTAGYKIDFANAYTPASHTLPFDLWMCATEMVSKAFDKRFSQGKFSEGVEGQSVSWLNEMTKEQKDILARYKNSHL